MRPTCVLCALACLSTAACNHHVYSPPARALPIESVAPVGEGRVGIGVEAAMHGAVLGPAAGSGAGRVRVSLHEDVDLSLEGNVIHIDGDPAVAIDQDIYAMRAGTKVRLAPVLAAVGGIGGGFHAAGTFVSPDLGLIAGWENDYVVPLISFRGFVSAPLTVHAVDTSAAGDEPGTDVGIPHFSGGFTAATGLRIPMLPSFDQNEGVRGSLLVAPGLTLLADGREDIVFLQFGGGGELTF